MKTLKGQWKRMLLGLILALVAAGPITGCVVHDDEHGHDHDHDHDWHDDHPDHP
jgi:hypothetical protein